MTERALLRGGTPARHISTQGASAHLLSRRVVRRRVAAVYVEGQLAALGFANRFDTQRAVGASNNISIWSAILALDRLSIETTDSSGEGKG